MSALSLAPPELHGIVPGRRPMKDLLRLAAMILGIWLIFAVFNASEFYRRISASGGAAGDWRAILVFQIQSSLVWATFTPLLIAIAERLPVRDRRWLRNLLLLAAVAPVLSILRAVVGGAWQELVEGKWPTLAFAKLSIGVRFHRNLLLIAIIFGITNMLLTYRRSVLRERDAYLLQAAVTNATIAQLRAHMLPRMMFDTLRTIAGRVDHDPMGADRMIVGLGDLLRATLDLDRRGDVTLAEELEHIDRYLDLEKARAGGRLTTRIEFDEPLLAARVPSLVLHALVEHALGGDAEGTATRSLQIRGRDAGGRLHIELRKDGDDSSPIDHADDETPRQLEQLLAEHFSFDRHREGTTDVLALTLPLRIPEVSS